jgi:hypothetical protein
MHLVQLLLPLYDNKGQEVDHEQFRRVRAELTGRFGGLTAFTRAPAEGLWRPEGEPTQSDDIVVFEVMVTALDKAWWQNYRGVLERCFRQEKIVVRAHSVTLL